MTGSKGYIDGLPVRFDVISLPEFIVVFPEVASVALPEGPIWEVLAGYCSCKESQLVFATVVLMLLVLVY